MLDSVVLIDHFNGVEMASRFLAEQAPDSVLSPITRAEVLSGFPAPHPAPVVDLLNRFHLAPIGAAEADRAARLRREHRWRLPDALQAAVALTNGLQLVTRDTRDFPPDRFAFVKVPYELP